MNTPDHPPENNNPEADLLTMKNINKRFMGVHALNNAEFSLNAGEVHALVGENGAGKSTLMKVLTGIYQKDSGDITLQNAPFHPHNPKHALQAGIGIIHQELNMMDHLTVAQNIFIGRESTRAGLFLSESGLNKRTQELLERLNMDIAPDIPVKNLTIGKQQMVEIAKAVSHDLKILVLDEPTAALTETEINELFTIMRNLATRGVGMIYISHRMDEINVITNRITVMRDGQYIGTHDTESVTKEEIIGEMVGRVIFDDPKTSSSLPDHAEVVLKVSNLNAGRLVNNISFELRRGEILGFAGLMGAGRTETARAIFGADKIQSGTIHVRGREVQITSPTDAVEHGIGYLSEDRKRYGLATGLSVVENSLLASYKTLDPGPFVHKRKTHSIASDYVSRLKIKTPSLEQLLRNLSGGNQQKVVIAKWLINDAEILVFDEPTRGIDVGAKSEIYTLMNELVARGKSIIMISSELPEILRMSDRILVMCEGRITGQLPIEQANQKNIMQLATQRKGQA